MAKFLEFEDVHSNNVLINVDLVTFVRATDAATTRLYFSEKEDFVTVKEPLDKIKHRLWHKTTTG